MRTVEDLESQISDLLNSMRVIMTVVVIASAAHACILLARCPDYSNVLMMLAGDGVNIPSVTQLVLFKSVIIGVIVFLMSGIICAGAYYSERLMPWVSVAVIMMMINLAVAHLATHARSAPITEVIQAVVR